MDQHLLLASAADYSEQLDGIYNEHSEAVQRAKFFMTVFDHDRNRWAHEEGGYSTRIFNLTPLTCTPKNNIIVGWAPHRTLPKM
jgi:hypothetical protein